MNLKRFISHNLLAALTFGAAMFASIPSVDAALSDPVSLPKGTVEGVLPNGLHYIILPADFPAGRTEFRLVWKVGSVQQDDNQGGAAHFLEHMAFGGSKHFPNRGAVQYLESLGMKYGIDINAFTGHDRTIYMFAVPTDSLTDPSMAKPLQIIRDWMTDLTINPARVETEKGIILEELRSTYQEDPFYDLKIGQNRFSSRMPLGTPDEVKKMTSKTLRDYYRKWYIPSLGAIVVSGSVDPEKVEKEIKRQFSSLKEKKDPGFRKYPLEYSPLKQIQYDIDSLNTNEEIEYIIPHPGLTVRTLEDARRKEMGNILVNALSRRFNEFGIRADVSDAWYLGDTNHLVFSAAQTREMPLDSCVVTMANEIQSALTYGFDENEIKYHIANKVRSLGRQAVQASKSSSQWCDDFADYIISGDRYLSDPEQIKELQQAVMTITPQEVHTLLTEWMAPMDSTVLVALQTSPSHAPSRPLERVLKWFDHGRAIPTNLYVFIEPAEFKVDTVPTPEVLTLRHEFKPEMIASTADYGSLGIRQYNLANGITLLVKPTADDGSALFGSVAPGGLAALDPKELPLYGSTASYIDMGTIAKATETTGDYMYQNGMALATALENDWHGFLGQFEPHNSREYFNLVFEKITDPELCREDFDEIKESMIESVGKESTLSKMLSRASDRQLMAAMDRLMGNTLDYGAAYEGVEDPMEARREMIRRMDLDSIANYFTTLYSRPEESIYLVCGNVNPDSIAAYFAASFSRLQPHGGERPERKTPLSLPAQTIKMRFNNENPSQTAFDYLYFGRFEPGLRNSLVLKLITNLLRNHIIGELREKRALVYSPFVDIFYEGKPRGYYYYDINSSAENSNMPKVHEAILEVLDHLRHDLPTVEELDAIKRSCIIAKRETLNPYSPASWRTILMTLIKNGESLADFNEYETIINSITPEEVRDACHDVIDPDLFVLLYMSDTDVKLD